MPIAGLQHIQHFVKSSSDSGAAFSHLCLIYSNAHFFDVALLNNNGKVIEADRYQSLNNPASSIKLPEVKHTVLALESKYSTLVPEQLFSEENASVFLSSQLSESTNQFVFLHFYLPELQAYLVSAFDPHLLDRSQQIVSNEILVDASVGLLTHWKLQAKQSNDTFISIAWRENSVEFTAWDKGKLHSYSKQLIQGSEDVSYLLFYFIEQLPLHFRSTNIYYSGWHSQQQAIVETLEQYHEKCFTDESFNQSFFTDLNRDQQSHLLTHLLSLTLCA
jgi:hypothetical protein